MDEMKGRGVTLRKPVFRITMIALVIIGLGFLFNLYFEHFSGDGKKTPEEALPTDHEYVWIKGPQTEKVHRYFFLSDGNYFGTGVLTKNLKGWSSGHGTYATVPKQLPENELTNAHSDNKIIYGLVKKNGNGFVRVNGVDTSSIELLDIPTETLQLYDIEGYSIWYVNLENLEETEKFTIQLLNEQNELMSELKI